MGILKNINRHERKCVGLATRSEALHDFLAALLEEWGHLLLTFPDANAPLFAENGCSAGSGWAETLRLGPPESGQPAALDFPLSLERLWRTLESRFFEPPRVHIRIGVQMPIKLNIRNRAVDAMLVNLSDLGCRVDLPLELVRGEEPLLQLRLYKQTQIIQGKVFYVIPGNDFPEFQVGIHFERIVPENRQLLRDFIVTQYLLRVREKIPAWTFNEGLIFFDLSPRILGALRCPSE